MRVSPPPDALVRVLLIAAVIALGGGDVAQAQQKIGYVDTQYVLDQMPEYKTVQQKLSKLEQQWRNEIEKQRKEVQTLEQKFEARELLYTDEERTRKRREIEQAREKVEQLRQQYFGPEGQLYTRQQELMRPIQERVLEAAESVATTDGYDYVVEKKGDALFLYAREEHDLSDRVLRELGINVEQQQTGQR